MTHYSLETNDIRDGYSAEWIICPEFQTPIPDGTDPELRAEFDKWFKTLIKSERDHAFHEGVAAVLDQLGLVSYDANNYQSPYENPFWEFDGEAEKF